MNAAAERVRACWDRACALGGFKGVDCVSIGAQIDAAVEVLSGPEKVAARALLCEAWRLASQFGDAERAAENIKLAVAMAEQAGRVLGALKAAQAVEDALWPDDCGSIPERCGVQALRNFAAPAERVVWAMTDNGFGPRPEVRRG